METQEHHKLDFLGIGASKAGTTSLFEYMRTHPALYLAPGKEEPFFNDDDQYYRRGWEEFAAAAFAGAPRHAQWGKITPRYMGGSVNWRESTRREAATHPERVVPSRIAGQFPSVKLIALLRDPVERAVSHYWQIVLMGAERRPLNEALLEQLEPDAIAEARRAATPATSYITAGEYGRALSGYLHYFGRDQLFIASSHSLTEDPTGVLVKLWRFLAVDDAHRPPNVGVRYSTRGNRYRVQRLDTGLLPRLVRERSASRALWDRMPAGVRNRIRSRYRDAAHRVNRWNRVRDEARHEDPDPEVLERLRSHYRTDLSLLTELVGPVPGLDLDLARARAR